MIFAFQAVSYLRALGIFHEFIGSIVRNLSEWGENRGVYPKIKEIIEERVKTLGLDENDLDNLVAAKGIKNLMNRLKAKIITTEEVITTLNILTHK